MDTNITLGFDDHVVVNGIKGLIDVFFVDAIGLRTENDDLIRIPWTEIKTFEHQGEAIPGQMCRRTLSRYIEYAKNNQ